MEEVDKFIYDWIISNYDSKSGFVLFLFDLGEHLRFLQDLGYIHFFHYYGESLDNLVISYRLCKGGKIYVINWNDLKCFIRELKINGILGEG